MTTKTSLTKQTIRVSRIFEILNGIDLCAGIDGSFGFSYALGRNKKILLDQAKVIEETNKADEEYEKYQRERQDLVEKLSKKNGDQPEYSDSQNPGAAGKIVYKDPETAEKELGNLAKEYAAAIEKRKAKNREYIKYITEESIEIEIYLVKKEYIPENKLTPEMVYGILEMLEDPE